MMPNDNLLRLKVLKKEQIEDDDINLIYRYKRNETLRTSIKDMKSANQEQCSKELRISITTRN